MADYLFSVGSLASITALVALGLVLLVPFSGYLSLAGAAFTGVGAYAFAITVEHTRSVPLAWLVAVGVALSASFVLGLAATRVRGEFYLLTTLAFQLVIVEVLRRWSAVTGGDSGLVVVRPVELGSTGAVLAVGAGAVLCVALVMWWRLRGPAGLILRAVRDDSEVAQAMGVSLRAWTLAAHLVAGVLFGFAGGLFAVHVGYINPQTFNVHWSIVLIVMAVMAGANVVGGVVSATVLVALPELIYRLVDAPGLQIAPIRSVIVGAFLVLLMLLRPRGLFPEQRYVQRRTVA